MAFAIFLSVSIIKGLLSLFTSFSFFFNDRDVGGEMKSYEFSTEISHLEVDIGAADFSIKPGDTLHVETNHPHLILEEKKGRLILREKTHWGLNHNDWITVTLYIPPGTVFETSDITTGAGLVSIDTLSAENLSLQLGAGAVSIDSLTATQQADIDGGAGQVIISDGALHNLDMDMGVGELRLTSLLTGRCDMDCGITTTTLTLLGSSQDYRIDAEKGLGEITVDGTKLSNDQVYGSGETEVDISGGIGQITIEFE